MSAVFSSAQSGPPGCGGVSSSVDEPVVIAIEALQKTYQSDGKPIQAVAPFDLNVRQGEFISVVGPSGCGKTTLLKMISGLVPATAGRIAIRGTPVTGPSDDIGIVFQSAVLLPWKTSLENVLLPVRVRVRVTREMRDRAIHLLELVGLGGFQNRYPGELSGGMQQRVAICRALIQDPTCILMDEPFGALDALTRENMNVFFNDLWRRTGKTVLLITHSIQEAVFLSTRVLVMSPRPGTVIDAVTVPFGSERRPEIIGSPAFGETANRLRGHFSAQEDAAMPGMGGGKTMAPTA
jgi:NitT/TauT family transport system ATP-binding protein